MFEPYRFILALVTPADNEDVWIDMKPRDAKSDVIQSDFGHRASLTHRNKVYLKKTLDSSFRKRFHSEIEYSTAPKAWHAGRIHVSHKRA